MSWESAGDPVQPIMRSTSYAEDYPFVPQHILSLRTYD